MCWRECRIGCRCRHRWVTLVRSAVHSAVQWPCSRALLLVTRAQARLELSADPCHGPRIVREMPFVRISGMDSFSNTCFSPLSSLHEPRRDETRRESRLRAA